MAESNDLCAHCGAPRVPGFAACKYCKTVFPREAQTTVQDNAVPCPQCRTLNEWGAQRCVQCQSWVVVQCVFCQAISPNHLPACLHCNEPFAGAPERLAMRQQQQTSQERLQVAQAVGGVAASFLGAIAGSAIAGGAGHSYSYSSYHHRHRESWPDSEGGGGFFDALSGSSSDDGSSSWGSDSGGGGDGGGLLSDLMDSGSSGDDD